ncbi:MAG: hypothetical protein OXU69_05745 [Gemmatimonadota bacterium]|nr:hypothetical protein [Gemmatimonadota bacterium]
MDNLFLGTFFLLVQGTFRRGWKKASLHQALLHGRPLDQGVIGINRNH